MGLAAIILNKMDTIQWGDLQPSEFADAGYKALAEGVYDYVLDVTNNATVECVATGVVNPPVPPAPYAGNVEIQLTFGTASLLQNLIKNAVNTGSNVPGSGTPPLFTAISTWLTTPPSGVCSITGWSVPGLGPVSGVGTVGFATMAAQGAPCSTQLLTDSPTTKEAAWDIMESFLLLGLVGVVTIPVVTGTVGTSVFTGVGTGSITYK